MLMEEEIIAEKLKRYSGQAGTKPVSGEESVCDPESDLYALKENLEILKNNQVSTSVRYIRMEAGIRGKLNWLKKKIVRRLSFFYVQPVCDQQTVFNTAVTESMVKIQETESDLYQKISGLYADHHQMNKKLWTNLQSVQRALAQMGAEMQQELADINMKVEQYSQNMEVIRAAEICKQISAPDTAFQRSYAQAGEDAVILFILENLHVNVQKASYLDLGANHAKTLSNTYALYEKGMRGVLLEANPELIPELKLNRSEDMIVHRCLALKSGRPVTFYVLSGDGLSTPDKNMVQQVMAENPQIRIVKEIEVDTITIRELMEQYFVQAPVVLNIDLEGMEYEILKQIDFARMRPLIIVVEMIAYSTMINAGKRNQQILKYMEENHYVEYAFTGINSVFVDQFVWEQKGKL